MGLSPATAHRIAFPVREPIGIVLAYSAFNHPINLIIHQVIPAVAVGAPVLVKPASTTPHCCMLLIKLLHEAGLPHEWAQVLLLARSDAEKFVSDPRIHFFSFIGSGAVGWRLRAQLAAGVGCTLEHGGAAPAIVAADADLERIIPELTRAAFYHAGQVCVSMQRIYAHSSIAHTLAQKLATQAQNLITGDPTLRNTDIGPMIQPAEVNRITDWVNEAQSMGGEILCGGDALSNTCFAPTVVLDPSDSCKLATEEAFAPVVAVFSYDTHLEALQRANALPFCFQASVYTQDLDAALYLAHNIKARTVMINDHTAFRADWMPFGGAEHSGIGLGGIPYTMAEYSRNKTLIFKSLYNA
jgi:acyl-CoA reductase-like NAD-dependent aldehyde dehydrogenase